MRAIKLTLSVLCLIAFAVGPIIVCGPHLLAEANAGDVWETAPQLRVLGARCHSFYFLISFCDIDYTDVTKPDRFSNTLQYFTPGEWGGEKVVLVRSRMTPSVVSMTLATANVKSRELLLIAWLVGGLSLAAAVIARLVSRPARSGSRDRPAEIVASTETSKGPIAWSASAEKAAIASARMRTAQDSAGPKSLSPAGSRPFGRRSSLT
jgi:hypothetical protein